MRSIQVTFLAAMAVTFSAWAGPYYRPINYELVNEQRNDSGRRCKRKIAGVCVEWEDWVDNRTVTAWDDNRRARGIAALTIVADRMLDPAITECALANARVEYHSGSPFAIPNWENFRTVVWGQMGALLNRGFPTVRMRIVTATDFSGMAEVGNYVDARYLGGSNFSVGGVYNFDVSTSAVDSNSADQLASTIVHEMLHQMTHDHVEYLDHNFVEAYESCVENNGIYVPNAGASLHGQRLRCGSRRGQ